MHPGRILLEDYLAPRGISVFHLAKDIGVSPRRIYEIVQGERPIGAELAQLSQLDATIANFLG